MDRGKKRILSIVGGVIVLGGFGCGQKAEETPATDTAKPTMPTTADGGGAGGLPPKQQTLQQQAAQAATKPGQATAANAPSGPVKALVKPGYDPFKVGWHNASPPPAVFDTVQPLRIATANVEAPPPVNTVVQEVPARRVSGIMSGEGVYAILEGQGDPEIVKPGSSTSDGYRVVSINADSVKLQKKDGNLLRTQIVKLTDVPVGGAQQTAAFRPASMGGPPGMSGFPGGGRGRGRMGGGGGKGLEE